MRFLSAERRQFIIRKSNFAFSVSCIDQQGHSWFTLLSVIEQDFENFVI